MPRDDTVVPSTAGFLAVRGQVQQIGMIRCMPLQLNLRAREYMDAGQAEVVRLAGETVVECRKIVKEEEEGGMGIVLKREKRDCSAVTSSSLAPHSIPDLH